MRSLLTISALIEPVAGLALLSCPSEFVSLLVGEPIETSAALTVARVGGAALFALGIACGFARGDSRSRAAKGLVAAMLLYNAATAVILAFAGIRLEMHGMLLWPGVGLHAALAAWCVACVAQSAKRMSGSPRAIGISAPSKMNKG
jgi:hypothetical protein